MKKSAIITAAGLAGLLGLTGCIKVDPNGPAISNFTAQTMLVKAEEPDRTNQTVTVGQPIQGQGSQQPTQLEETCYKVLNNTTGMTEAVFPPTQAGARELDIYLTAHLKDGHKRTAMSIERGRVLGIGTCYLDENGKLVEEVQNFVKK